LFLRLFEGGEEECEAVKEHFSKIPSDEWRIFAHLPLNSKAKSPQLILAYRIGKN
jgi:hypothetical protein